MINKMHLKKRINIYIRKVHILVLCRYYFALMMLKQFHYLLPIEIMVKNGGQNSTQNFL